MHLGDYGESAVLIDNSNQGLYAAGLIYAFAYSARFAKTESTVAQTLRLLHYPHLFVFKIIRPEHRQFAPTAFGDIHPKRLGV